MFKFDELCELIRLVGSTEVAMVEIEHAGGRLRIDGKAPAPVVSHAAADGPGPGGGDHRVRPGDCGTASRGARHTRGPGVDEDLHYVVSPIVGTFYRAPNPDADPYAKVGDMVDGGKTLCIIEAMKLMNEIESDLSGTIVKVFPENAQPVEFGERLFAIRQS